MSNAWVFPPSSGGEFVGLNDAGIETFAGSPYSSLAREVIQNSLDAGVDADDRPVRVFFDLVKVPASDFPDLAGLKRAVRSALSQAKSLKESEGVEFFTNALSVLSAKHIQLLRMADSNTKGLRGPFKLKSHYFAFMKTTGHSVKNSKTAGGSFGIGKNAPFALSDLRTIFVSTSYGSGKKRVQLAQGKSILMSHTAPDGSMARGTGYYGDGQQCAPISPASAIPAWLRRDTQFTKTRELQGTTVFVAGFRSSKHWQGLLISSLISNYFSAIHEGRLEATIDDGEYVISSTNLRKWFSHKIVTEAADAEDVEDKYAESMAQCLVDKATLEEKAQLPLLGHCRVRLLVAEGLPKRVGMVRNGMLVTHQLKGLQQFPGSADFVAIVDCLDEKGNEYLRSMENPEHNGFEPDRLRPDKAITRARKELKLLAEFVRRSVNKHAQIERGEVTELDELSKFFQDPDEEVPTKESKAGETDIGGDMTIVPKAPRRKIFLATVIGDDDSDEAGGGGSGEGASDTGGGGEGSGTGGGTGGKGGRKQPKTIGLEDIRCVVISKTERVIHFTPTVSGKVNLRVEDVGADVVYPVGVKKVKAGGGKAQGGEIKGMRLQANRRKTLRVVFAEEFNGAVRVVANEV